MNAIRFSGIASGLDTEAIIQNLMRVERMPLDRIKQDKQVLQWKMDSYRAVNTQLSTFRSDSLLTMRMESTFLSKTVTSSDSSKVTATALASVGNISYVLDKVSQLATSATNSSSEPIGTGIDLTKSLYSQRDALEGITWKSTSCGNGDGVSETIEVTSATSTAQLKKLTSGGEIQFEGQEPTIVVTDKNGTETEYEVVTDLDELEEGAVYINPTTGEMTFGDELSEGSTIDASYDYMQNDTFRTDGTPTDTLQLRQQGEDSLETLTVRDYTVSEDGERTYSNEREFKRVDDINDLEEGKFFVDDDGKITFYEELPENTEVNAQYSYQYAEANMTIHQEGGPVETTFKFDAGTSLEDVINEVNKSDSGVSMFFDEATGKISVTRTETGSFNEDGREMEFGGFFSEAFKLDSLNEKGGTNAEFTINGLETTRTSNEFTIEGMDISLKSTFSDPVTIQASNNTEDAFDAIVQFVNEYNALIAGLNGQLQEGVNRDYKPLTDEQRAEMTQEEIEKWEEEARSGILRNDQYLSSVVEGMRTDFYNAVNSDGAFSQLAQIGITTTANYLDGGKLEINEEKLREALKDDPESVYELFTSDDEAAPGIEKKLNDTVSATMELLTRHAGSGLGSNNDFTMGRNLDAIDKQISDWERRLQVTEDRHWAQFTGFEVAMQQQNDQLNYLLAQFGMAPQQ
ncbi:flagellar filament capping protein FliD [Jeotgalibacillus marinus]|uniref:Flagellar hook-associated protein 2 n=1 Tax=Jeotgalibacillus marinus TaxID=86667 RepID=A0ABV3Q538_9BACL